MILIVIIATVAIVVGLVMGVFRYGKSDFDDFDPPWKM